MILSPVTKQVDGRDQPKRAGVGEANAMAREDVAKRSSIGRASRLAGAAALALVGSLAVGKVALSAAKITEYPVPTAGSSPGVIAAGPDGNLWFTESSANKIGRISTAGTFTEFSVPTASSSPRGIAVGPDGALWVTEHDADKIGRITTT